MARKSRKQKKRRTRRKRGGLTPKQTKQCEAAGIPGFPPAKCQEYLTTKKKKDKVIIELAEAAKKKPSKAIPCKDDDTATYGKNKKGNCKNLREKQAFIDKVCKDQAGQHCIKTCGTCNKKICQLQSMSGGRRTRRRKGGNCTGVSKSIIKKFPNPIPCSTPRLLPPMRINVPLDYENITPRQQKTKETKESVKELPGAVVPGAAGGKRRRRRRKSRRKSRKRKSRRKSKHKRR